ncbi:MAG: hypothetical protein DRI36_02245 [Caldiserica bacterium]|nr:MAG: hypothetical protein DRI36_02245 [Caldisericota bacterium]
MRKIILILFIFVMTVYAEKKEIPEQTSEVAKERKTGSPSQKKTNFDIEAYKAYEEALMNPQREEIIARNLKIEKIYADEAKYFKLFDKNTGKIIKEYEDVRIYISEDKSCTLIRPWGPSGYSEDEKIILFDNVNLKVLWEKSLKWFKERYGRYPSGSAGISKQGELVGLVLYPQELVPPPLIINILVINKKGKLVSEMEYEGHFLGGEKDTLEFSPKLKLMIGKEKRKGKITYIVFSIKAEKLICKSRAISYSPDEKYLAALRRPPHFESDELRKNLPTRELVKEYYRIMGVSEDKLSKRELSFHLEDFIKPFIDIYEVKTGKKIGSIMLPIEGYVWRWKRLKSGSSIVVCPVKEMKFSEDGSKIFITTEYEGKVEKYIFTVKGAKEFLKKQRKVLEKLREKKKAIIEEKKIPQEVKQQKKMLKYLREKVREIRETAKERGLNKHALKELKRIERKIKDHIDIRMGTRIEMELVEFEVKHNLMGHLSYVKDRWYIEVKDGFGGGTLIRGKERILRRFPIIHPEVLKKLEEGKSKE